MKIDWHVKTRLCDLQFEAASKSRNILEPEEIQISEEKYRTILKSIEDGYFETDIKGNFTFANDAMKKILGYDKNELLGINYRQYIDKDIAKKVFQIFNRVYKTGDPIKGFEFIVITKENNKVNA